MKIWNLCLIWGLFSSSVLGIISNSSIYPIKPLLPHHYSDISIISMKIVQSNDSWSFLRDIWKDNPMILNFYGLGLLKEKKSLKRELGCANLWYINTTTHHPVKMVADCFYVSNSKNDEPLTYMIAVGCRPHNKALIDEIRNHSVTLRINLLSINWYKIFNMSSSLYITSNISSLPVISVGNFVTNLHAKYSSPPRSGRKNGVCTVQVFSNQLTGPRLYFFASYYLQLGLHVIIYDRYGRHRSYLQELLRFSLFHYYPFTVLELILPNIYNHTSALQESTEVKYYFQRNIIKSASKTSTTLQSIDTANQNSDKQKTYDYCRIEYQHLNSILFVDSDEFFHCEIQKRLRGSDEPTPIYKHTDALDAFFKIIKRKHYEEVSLRRYNTYSLLWKLAHQNVTVIDSTLQIDASTHLTACLLQAYDHRSLKEMFGCWSNQQKTGLPPKALDVGSRCPFHWNHVMCKINTLDSNSMMNISTIKYDENIYQCPCRVLNDESSPLLPLSRDLKLKCSISHLAKYFHDNRGSDPEDIYNYPSTFERFRLPPGYI